MVTAKSVEIVAGLVSKIRSQAMTKLELQVCRQGYSTVSIYAEYSFCDQCRMLSVSQC